MQHASQNKHINLYFGPQKGKKYSFQRIPMFYVSLKQKKTRDKNKILKKSLKSFKK